jgi:uroporphyrinogen decarboxylase
MPVQQNKLESQNPSKVLQECVFLKACRREKTERTPIWLMRQAGRFQPEYRKIREKVSFLELCKNSELASEVTVMAVDMLGVDAGIIFADILLPLECLGVGLTFAKGDGPVIHNPVACAQDVQNLKLFSVESDLGYVCRSIEITKAALNNRVPLIGFAGAPFTLASYLIEGGSSRNFDKTKVFMHCESVAWHKLMELLTNITTAYLNAQINAGADAVQIFDSWVGCLSPSDYRQFVAPHMKALISGITPGVPVIHFGTNTATILDQMKSAGGDVIGLDWRVELDQAWQSLGDTAVQGNLDPVCLLTDEETIEREARRILAQANGHPGHIFNLGHGILPNTPVANVKHLVAVVKELSSEINAKK